MIPSYIENTRILFIIYKIIENNENNIFKYRVYMLFMVRKVTLTKEKAMDSWSYLIDDAAGKGEEFFGMVSKLIEEQRVPTLKTERVKAFSGLAKRVFLPAKHGKDYLVVEQKNIENMKIYVRAIDYGKNLFVAWYLVAEPGIFGEFLASIEGKIKQEEYQWHVNAKDIFNEEELTAYASCVHHCVLEAVERIMRDLGKDTSNLNRRSSGFLGVS